jgi:hypothetical protein
MARSLTPVEALGKDIELVVVGKQLDLNALADLLPRLVEQVLLQPVQPSLGRADDVLHRRIAVAHLGQDRLGRHAAVHHPDPPRLAVLLLDPGEERAQRLAVGGVAGQHLVGQRQALGRDHQGDHHPADSPAACRGCSRHAAWCLPADRTH